MLTFVVFLSTGSYGRVLKGGIPDKVAAARAVLKDWNGGKIPYFTAPPAVDHSHKSADAVIVGEFAPAFDAMDAAVLGTMKEDDDADEMDFVQLNPMESARPEWKGFDDDDEEMDEDSDSDDAPVSHSKRRQQLAQAEDYDFDEDL